MTLLMQYLIVSLSPSLANYYSIISFSYTLQFTHFENIQYNIYICGRSFTKDTTPLLNSRHHTYQHSRDHAHFQQRGKHIENQSR